MKAVIIDDNEIDRMNLRTLMEDHPGIEIIGEAELPESAVELIHKTHPEVVFLDIHLGHQKGFQILEQVRCKPQVIITTAHPHYALQGFEIAAVDYLLKPITEKTLARAIGRLAGQKPSSKLAPRWNPSDMQLFKEGTTLHVVPVSAILAITGERIYSRVIVLDNPEYLHNRPLREWRDLLPEKMFQPLDRSTIVNLGEVRSVSEADKPGRYQITFRRDSRRGRF
jgi:two-component system LytT family response regulator